MGTRQRRRGNGCKPTIHPGPAISRPRMPALEFGLVFEIPRLQGLYGASRGTRHRPNCPGHGPGNNCDVVVEFFHQVLEWIRRHTSVPGAQRTLAPLLASARARRIHSVLVPIAALFLWCQLRGRVRELPGRPAPVEVRDPPGWIYLA